MSQSGVESLLGRLVTDQGFRKRFYDDPAVVCATEFLEVTTRELEAVLALDEQHVATFAEQLDPRIVRAAVGDEPLGPKAAARPLRRSYSPSDAGPALPKQHRVR